jgi:hypothetical protein
VSVAQTLTIRVLDAKSGKPLSGENITLRWDNDTSVDGVVLALDREGKASIEVRRGAVSFQLSSGPKRGKEPYRIAYLDCNEPSLRSISIQDVLENGVLPANGCGQQKTQVHPGEIVYWGLPRRWWQPDMQ